MPVDRYPFRRLVATQPPRPYLPIKIFNPHENKSLHVWGQIDTGADSCVVPAFIAVDLGHTISKGTKTGFTCAKGDGDGYLHTTIIDIVIPGKKPITIINAPVACVDGVPNVLLGVNNFLSNFILTVNYPEQWFSLKTPRMKPKKIKPFTKP